MAVIALRTAWALPWGELPNEVHARLSTGRVPKKAVITGMFPTTFADLEPALRRYDRIKANPAVPDEDRDRIAEAVARARPILVATAHNLALATTIRGDDHLGMSNPLETLSRLAWLLATSHGAVDERAMRLELSARYPTAATVRNVRLALRDPALTEELTAVLSAATPLEPVGPRPDLAATAAVLMGSTALAAAEVGDEIVLDEVDLEAWRRLLAHPDLGAVHRSARGLALAHRVPVPVPGLAVDAPRPRTRTRPEAPAIEPPARVLELSIVGRLHRALDVDRVELVGLAAPAVLRSEVRRVTRPLGLDSAGAHALFALVREVALELGQAGSRSPGATPVGQSFVRAFRRFESAKRSTQGYARTSVEVLAVLDDPTEAFVVELWGRMHGHEVRSSLDLADLGAAFSHVVLGVRTTLLRRLDKQAGSVLGSDASADQGVVTRGVVRDNDLSAEHADRAAVLAALLAAITEVAASGIATRDEVGAFLHDADADAVWAEVWDRWKDECGDASWPDYLPVVEVLPLLRRETYEPPTDSTPDDKTDETDET